MKLAFLTASLDRQGKEEGFIVDWVDALAKEVDELVVFILKPQTTPLKSKNVRVYELAQKTKLGKLLYLYSCLIKEYSLRPFDGLFCHIFEFLAVAGGLWARIYNIKSYMWYAGGIGLNKYSLLWLAMKISHGIITCSHVEKNRYRKAFHLNKPIHVLGHAVDTGRFRPATGKKANTTFIIGFVGRATPNKNIQTLIKATAPLKTKTLVKLALSRTIENREYTDSLKVAIKSCESKWIRYEIIDNLSYNQLSGLYHSLNLYIHPSLMQSVDKAGIEAISCGIPVLLSSYGYKEVAKESPEVLFNPKSAKELTAKIKTTIKLIKKNTLDQSKLQEYVRNYYSTKEFMSRLVKIFKKKEITA